MEIIQGGMGVGVSSWGLARAVSMQGQLGVVSGTALDTTLVRRLADGDVDGALRRAIRAFPDPVFASEVLERYFRPQGRGGEAYPALRMLSHKADPFRERLLVLANFVEVFLAKEDHQGQIGINYLTKIRLPTLPSLFGAMLADVDYVLMGAGIPWDVPGALDALARGESAELRFDIAGDTGAPPERLTFDPAWTGLARRSLRRPGFLPIVSSHTLATALIRRATGSIEGFVVEGPTAGGHNAPPRGRGTTDSLGQPVYGARDVADLDRIAALDLPFWLAGGCGSPEKLREARAAGAAGVQVGTLFAFAAESGLGADMKDEVVRRATRGQLSVMTDGRASPTGFPFKTVALDGSLSDPEVYSERERVCDLGYLREAHRRDDGRVVFRCPAEPVETYTKKGGAMEDTVGRRCLCNALVANVGLAQERSTGAIEAPLLTSGDDLLMLGDFLDGRVTYSASDVVSYLLEPATAIALE